MAFPTPPEAPIPRRGFGAGLAIGLLIAVIAVVAFYLGTRNAEALVAGSPSTATTPTAQNAFAVPIAAARPAA